MSTAVQTESAPTSALPAVFLRVLLLALSVACLVGFWQANAHTDDYRLQYPLFTPRLWNLYLTFSLVSVVAMVGIWNWRMWGVWLLVGMAVAIVFTEFFTMGFSIATLRVPVALAVVWFAVQRNASRFQ